MKKLIYKDTGAKTTFRNEVETVRNKVNSLITAFNETQDFTTIDSQEQFELLIQNPADYFDSILIQNCELKTKTGRKPEASILANLFGINREGYLEAIGWEVVNDFSTKGGTKAQPKLIHQKELITASKYSDFKAYLVFDRFFKLNEPAIEEKLNDFDIYAESPETLKLVEHYEELSRVLNEAIIFHKVGGIKLQELAKMFGLLTLDNKLVINYYSLSQQIKYL
jgi:hypothetical protein